MIFEFTEQQKMIQKMVREFAEKEIAPGVMEREEKEEFSRDLFDKAGKLGMTGICFPEEYGGSGGDYISYIIINEEIARVAAVRGRSGLPSCENRGGGSPMDCPANQGTGRPGPETG